MLHRLHLRRLLAGAAALTFLLTVSACGDDSDDADDAASAEGSGSTEGDGGGGDPIVLGYSAWPGWFPLAIADQEGIFEEAGVDVELRFFADYLGSLDAMAAGELDGNTQTLNDTMFAVAAGSPQTIVTNNDNSTGNDAIICDESVTSIEDQVVSGDRVWTRATSRGVNLTTDDASVITWIVVHRIEGDRIAETWSATLPGVEWEH